MLHEPGNGMPPRVYARTQRILKEFENEDL